MRKNVMRVSLVVFLCSLILIGLNKKMSKAAEVEELYSEINAYVLEMSNSLSSDFSSSNPYDYIEGCSSYDKLVSLGEEALPTIYNIVKNSDESLTSYILACAMEDISQCNLYETTGIDWSTSEEFIKAWEIHNKNKIPIVTRKTVDYKKYYKFVECKECEVGYDENDKDSKGNPRQYGVKLCDKHKEKMADNAFFYEYGYTDYNCMAYALGKNEPCSWVWPSSWGKFADVKEVTKYFKWRGYTVEDFDETKYEEYKAKNAILVYGYMSSMYDEYKITHFARVKPLDGEELPDNQKTISKWGQAAIYTTQDINSYGVYSGYGQCVLVCYK